MMGSSSTGFCSPSDSIPVMVMNGPRIIGVNSSLTNSLLNKKTSIENKRSVSSGSSLFAARNMFNSTLKKLSGSSSTLITNNRDVSAEKSLSPSVLKIPTPSMLNQQLPPPFPTIITTTNSDLVSKIAYKTKLSPQQQQRLLSSTTTPTTKTINLLNPPLQSESLLNNDTDDVFLVNSSLIQEEQAAAAALLGQFSNF